MFEVVSQPDIACRSKVEKPFGVVLVGGKVDYVPDRFPLAGFLK